MNTQTRFCLRPWNEDDIESLVTYANNPVISAHLRDGFPYPYSREDGVAFLKMTRGISDGLVKAVEINGEAVGGVGVFRLPDVYRCRAEIGYWLGEPFWGQGIMTEVIKTFIPVAFDFFPVNRLEAGIFSSNPSSMRVLEKCGFHCEAVLKCAIIKRGVILDEHRYVLFRDEQMVMAD